MQKNIGVSFTRKDYFSLYISKCHAYFPCYWLFFVATCEIYEQFLSENYLSFYQCSFGQKICLGPGNPDHCPPGNSNFNITVHLTQRNLKVTRLDFWKSCHTLPCILRCTYTKTGSMQCNAMQHIGRFTFHSIFKLNTLEPNCSLK